MRLILTMGIGAVLALAMAGGARAQNVNTPPPGPGYDVLLDLAAGTAVPTATSGPYSKYTETFVAAQGQSTITFAFRNDPGYFALDNVSAIDVTTPSGNLLTNGDFGAGSTGLVTGITIPGWTFAQDPSVAGQIANTGVYDTTGYAAANGDGTNSTLFPLSPSTQMFLDGAYFAYDTLAQNFATTIGDTYSISFWIADSISLPYSTLDTSGYTLPAYSGDGLGHDLVLYGPEPIPEPTSLALLGVGLAGLGLLGRRWV